MGWRHEIGNINEIMLFQDDQSPIDEELDFFEDPEIQQQMADIGISKEEFLEMEKTLPDEISQIK